MPNSSPAPEALLVKLTELIQQWGREQGFQQIAITDVNLTTEQQHLEQWLSRGFHGTMAWMAENSDKRGSPEKLLPGAQRVISARMDYLPPDTEQIKILKSPQKAYVSRYALGRDYHKLIRKRLALIANQIQTFCDDNNFTHPLNQRAFVDSAPVLERPLAEKAGLGWVGKHTLLINEHAGSWFFLGEILTSLPLPLATKKMENRCGDCEACLKICPTDAFPAPYQLDARRCISYLTIENKGAIPIEFREVMGNRVFGCDDCQAICPWNKFAKPTTETDFHPRHSLESSDLVDLFLWDEQQFLKNTEGSAIRRIGYQNWLRNLAVGLGNAPASQQIIEALTKKRNETSPPITALVAEHIDWALSRQITPPKRRQRKLKASH
ncbi:tRNA epoxyqueuosine(34) reductase QueG [Teredinibacter waterburyi]|uniref:tRNA epoxyqueuosine(34) reductase QueG n=1 Tax=Teredinibacter waterburyi TaxID=1500538 RepID=UPI00165F93DA|nr:tRNA epoxyqueuosine(34) reductase QueG [Teredinibacter waterburyi]